MFGGCGNDTVCHDNSLTLECHNDNESKETGLIGTCTPELVDFSTVTFGSGYFRNGNCYFLFNFTGVDMSLYESFIYYR